MARVLPFDPELVRIAKGDSVRNAKADAKARAKAAEGKAPRHRRDDEHIEQAKYFLWVRGVGKNRYPGLEFTFAVPNELRLGGNQGPAAQKAAARMQARLAEEGKQPGPPDVVVPMVVHEINLRGKFLRWPGLYIEFKTKTGSLSADQRRYRDHLIGQGYAYVLARSAEEAQAATIDYLEGRHVQS